METPSIYKRPKFLGLLLEIRQQMARDADYDVDLFAEMVRSGTISENVDTVSVNDAEAHAPEL